MATKTVEVLLIDDDVELCASLTRLLDMDGFRVTSAHDADSGMQLASSGDHQIIILDVMLPGGDGRKLLRRIRLSSAIPVIMLTARGDEADRIAGLEGGADDYLPKPFNPRELVARLRAVLRRKGDAALPRIFKLGDLEFDTGARKLVQAGTEIVLTGAEFDILLLLARSGGKVLSRDEIAEQGLGRPVGPLDRSIDNHISNLRKKLAVSGHDAERIRSVRGSGYIYIGEA